MSTIRRNTIANYAGQAWSALMSLAFVPLYIRYIGIEAYGIIGFFIALQSLFSFLDLGISAVLNRELARRSALSTPAAETRDLLRTLEWISWSTGILIALAISAVAQPLAQHWLTTVSLSPQQAAYALILLAISAGLLWPVSFYTGGLAGLQRQVFLNALGAAFGTVRAVGAALVVMLVSPTLEAFLYWQILMSGVQSAVYAWFTWRQLPPAAHAPSFSLLQLRQVGGFAAGITALTILSFLLTHTDRIVLSKLLPLDEFGVYAFAASAAMALLRLVSPIVTAVYPRYTELVASGKQDALVALYHRTNQFMAATLLPIAVVAVLFSNDILWMWSQDERLAAGAASIFSFLVAGTAINGLLNLPYALQLAHGWTALSFWINVVSVAFVVPAVWLAGREFGGIGAAAVWLILHLAYVFVGTPLMHRRLLRGELARWYLVDLLPPLIAAAAVGILWRTAFADTLRGPTGAAALALVSATTFVAALVASPAPRTMLAGWLTRYSVLRRG